MAMYKRAVFYIVLLISLSLLIVSCSNSEGTSSVKPKISNFHPKKGKVGSVVTIEGKNFSTDSSKEVVEIGGHKASINSTSMKQIKVKVPTNLDPGLYPISVEAGGYKTTTQNKFKVIESVALEISAVSPLSGSADTIVTIKGTGFSATKSKNVVKFGNKAAAIVIASPTQLKVKVPKGVSPGFVSIEVSVNGKVKTATAQEKFKYFIVLVPTSTSNQKGQIWKYTTKVQDNKSWTKPSFDASSWESGPAGFGGTFGSPLVQRRTKWLTSDIYLRKTFQISNLQTVKSGSFTFKIFHDEGTQVYINGIQVLSVSDYVTSYHTLTPNQALVRSALKEGTNTIAVHTHQISGGQYIDVGLFDK